MHCLDTGSGFSFLMTYLAWINVLTSNLNLSLHCTLDKTKLNKYCCRSNWQIFKITTLLSLKQREDSYSYKERFFLNLSCFHLMFSAVKLFNFEPEDLQHLPIRVSENYHSIIDCRGGNKSNSSSWECCLFCESMKKQSQELRKWRTGTVQYQECQGWCAR